MHADAYHDCLQGLRPRKLLIADMASHLPRKPGVIILREQKKLVALAVSDHADNNSTSPRGKCNAAEEN